MVEVAYYHAKVRVTVVRAERRTMADAAAEPILRAYVAAKNAEQCRGGGLRVSDMSAVERKIVDV